MSPTNNIKPASNNYTALLALATGVVIATSIFVVVKCVAYYGTFLRILGPPRF